MTAPDQVAPVVSVVVPFRDAAGTLPALVDALRAQEPPPDTGGGAVEFLFVDNGSHDAGPGLVADALAAGLPGRLLSRDDVASSYAARNAGVAQARGDVLAFTDADCRPTPSWLAAIVAFYDGDHADTVVAGAVDLVLVDDTSVWELFDHAVHLDNESMAVSHRVATADMAVRREVFDRVGPFRELTSGADHEWSRRASAAGVPIRFVPSVRVHHPTRATRRALLDKAVRISRGQGELAVADPSRRWSLAARAVARPLLLGRHLDVARTPAARGGLALRARLFGVSVVFRLRQVPAFVAGWRAARDAADRAR